MFDARQYRAQSRQASAEEKLLWAGAAAVAVCTIAVVFAAVHVLSAPVTPASRGPTAAGDGAKGAGHYAGEWLQFNRNRRDGESAEDFVYANCMAASAYAGGMRSMGVDPFANVQATLDKHSPKGPPSKRSADEACKEASRGYRWKHGR